MLNFVERLLCGVVAAGPVPSHVAFVMDGNRRFSSKQQQAAAYGHSCGAHALKTVAAACAAAGVRVVSVFAFALANFYRNPPEVEALLSLAENTFKDPQWIRGFLMAEGIRLAVVGDLSFVGPQLQAAAAAAERETRSNSRMLLRICVSYGARHEVYRVTAPLQQQQQQQQQQQRDLLAVSGVRAPLPTEAAAAAAAEAPAAAAAAASDYTPPPLLPPEPLCIQLRSSLTKGLLKADKPTSELGKAFWRALQGGDCPLPELLIRTSGEARLSDFLLCEVQQQQQQQQQR
ncbi:dehydrodolichyl diphosphate synthase, putative [Eimeria tenella]|uniref:Alkyl transferase n=1 Tax=Eimeria tenella TaxID=5802 RepID=U6KUV7_EIMTE|nr:dehydrodolichyl diphosphate synthase, putative [Eimeria tenella]CDJ40708.1 dehydrodolichyl diphosphate synthase, putative [Eimeria tenella]|eukprot:XP_013231458.1 dehydrodolichyl diphosphate synthase, putative [Eimeria tenella]